MEQKIIHPDYDKWANHWDGFSVIRFDILTAEKIAIIDQLKKLGKIVSINTETGIIAMLVDVWHTAEFEILAKRLGA